MRDKFDIHTADRAVSVDLPYPEGLGTAAEVLKDIAVDWQPVLDRVDQLRDIKLTGHKVYMVEGWSKDGVPCEPPSHETGCLDFEAVEVSGVWLPICCCFTTLNGLYQWMTFSPKGRTIPFGTHNVILGADIAYDRQYLRPEYLLAESHNRFICTRATAIATRGISNQQTAILNSPELHNANPWVHDVPKGYGLAALYNFYTYKELAKETRDSIVKDGLAYWLENPKTVLQYCLSDTLATLEVW